MNLSLNIDTSAIDLWDTASINTEDFLKLTMDGELNLPEEIANDWMMARGDDIRRIIEDDTGREYREVCTDNVFNSENDFDSVFQFTVFAPEDEPDWVWGNGIYIAVEVHLGGDVRGNYGATRLYNVDSPGDSGFLDWMIGWDMRDASTGERFENRSERTAPGYASNPTAELEGMLSTTDVEWNESEGAFEATDEDGNIILISPYTYK